MITETPVTRFCRRTQEQHIETILKRLQYDTNLFESLLNSYPSRLEVIHQAQAQVVSGFVRRRIAWKMPYFSFSVAWGIKSDNSTKALITCHVVGEKVLACLKTSICCGQSFTKHFVTIKPTTEKGKTRTKTEDKSNPEKIKTGTKQLTYVITVSKSQKDPCVIWNSSYDIPS